MKRWGGYLRQSGQSKATPQRVVFKYTEDEGRHALCLGKDDAIGKPRMSKRPRQAYCVQRPQVSMEGVQPGDSVV